MTETKPILPAESSGTEMTRFNALRHGVLSRYTVLPWEDAGEYHTLVAALVAEHAPQGPTEEHLVEELAGILWRKRRLRLAEAAAHRRGLEGALAPWSNTVEAALVHLGAFARWEGVADAIRATQAETEKDMADIEENEAITRHALDLLGSDRNEAYEAALAALRDDTRQWWEDQVTGDTEVLDEDKKRYPGDTAGLRDFLEGEILPRLARRGKELSYRPLIREQALGEALNLGKLEQLDSPGPQARTHADHAAPAKGTAPASRDHVIRFAKKPKHMKHSTLFFMANTSCRLGSGTHIGCIMEELELRHWQHWLAPAMVYQSETCAATGWQSHCFSGS